MSTIWIAGGAVALVLIVCLRMYNGLIRKKNAVENAFSDVDTTLKKRFDLVPNLVAVVKQYMHHEADTLIKIAELRSRTTAGPAGSPDRVALENQLTKALGGLMVAVENYPQLKANQNFLELQKQMADLEDQLQMARRYYNGTVRDYNIHIQTFPDVLIASVTGFHEEHFFQIDEASAANPNVKF